MARDPSCIFCKIVAVEVPAEVVLESESLIAFLDVSPLAEGHLLFVPRDHYALLTDLPPALASEMGAVLPRLGRALLDVTGAAGFNLLQNNREAAGQIVPHVHFHLIPRMPEDGLGYRWNAGKYGERRAEILAAEYQTALSQRPS